MKYIALILLLGASLSVEVAQAGTLDEVLSNFVFISSYDRRSGKEAAVRDAIIRGAKDYQPRWNGVIEIVVDAAGNLLVRLPATGRFVGSGKVIALQSHLDMVPAARDAKENESLDPWFANGIAQQLEWVNTGGVLRSKGHSVSIGADNGIGVAMMLRYLTVPHLEHPELELVFTVEEETTFRGALNIDLPLRATAMINLDGEDPNELWVGCMGFTTDRFKLEYQPVRKEPSVFIDVKISGLKGGHSGVNAHKLRMNAGDMGLQLIQNVLREFSRVDVISLNAGVTGFAGSIPATLSLRFSAPDFSTAGRLENHLRGYLVGRFPQFSDEENLAQKVSVTSGRLGGVIPMLSRESWDSLVRRMQKLPRGILVRDAQFPLSVKTTANVGFIRTEYAPETQRLEFEFVYGGRSYEDADILARQVETQKLMRAHADPALDKLTSTESYGPGWINKENWLLSVFREFAPKRKPVYVPGTLESGAIGKRYRGMEIVSFGPRIDDIHTEFEKTDLANLVETTELLDRGLIRIADRMPSARSLPAGCSEMVVPPDAPSLINP